MKISERTHPVLKYLREDKLGVMPIYEDDKPFFDANVKPFTSFWKHYSNMFKNEVNVLSKDFGESAQKAENKLIELYSSIAKDDIADMNISGTYIMGNYCIMFHQKFEAGSEDIETVMYVFTQAGMPIAFYVDNDTVFQTGWVSKIIGLPTDHNNKKTKNFIYRLIMNCIITAMFKTYAEVETKYLPANSKVKGIDCKYVNDTNCNITFLDSKWFTTLVKSDAFKVRGHFRLQAHGEGMKERKLIWISDFEKTGYTAPARKLNTRRKHNDDE